MGGSHWTSRAVIATNYVAIAEKSLACANDFQFASGFAHPDLLRCIEHTIEALAELINGPGELAECSGD
jgi:hypothetical protein